MNNEIKHKLTLDRPTSYQIQVPGQLDSSWAEWAEGMTITVNHDSDGPVITTLAGKFDQAALQGLMRRLYSLGLPIISVKCIESG